MARDCPARRSEGEPRSSEKSDIRNRKAEKIGSGFAIPRSLFPRAFALFGRRGGSLAGGGSSCAGGRSGGSTGGRCGNGALLAFGRKRAFRTIHGGIRV